jgi:magnesium transporter
MVIATDLMTVEVPKAAEDQTVSELLSAIRQRPWEELSHIYLVDCQNRLIGQVPIESLLTAEGGTKLSALRGAPPVEVQPDDNAETVALRAVERHDADVAVIDRQQHLLGAIPIGRLLALLHEEHVDNFLRMGGIGAVHPEPTAEPSTVAAFRARIPWLAIGLIGGFLAGGVASFFELALKQEVALVFFLPLVVYMADAVGTQTETILVRALAYGHVSVGAQLLREGACGITHRRSDRAAGWIGIVAVGWTTWYGAGRGLDPRYHSCGGHSCGECASVGARASRSGPGHGQRTCRHGVARYPERGDLSQHCNDGSALVTMRMP